MHLSAQQEALLAALQQGDRLQVHRTLDGLKQYRLHRLDASATVEVPSSAVIGLEQLRLIESNPEISGSHLLAHRPRRGRCRPSGPAGTDPGAATQLLNAPASG